MKNLVRTLCGEGRSALLTNVAAPKTSGQLFVSPGNSGIVAVHKLDAASSATLCSVFIGAVEIVYTKLTADVIAVGDILYYDAANDWLTVVAGALKKAGIATSAIGAVAGTVRCALGEIR